jgi:hypothetical protein
MNNDQKNQKDNLYIKEIIKENKPFFIGRIAGCELKVAYNFLNGRLKLVDDLIELENNAGIKIKDNGSLKKYVEKLVESYDHCTVIAEWAVDGKVFMHTGIGQKIITSRTLNIPKISALALEPYYFKDSWMSALKGKKILIVHPFSKTLSKQVLNLKNIFPNISWFEECEFQFIQPPFTLAGNHEEKDWQEHLESFLELLQKVKDFDVALVAAGGYGMLISDYIFKEMSKSVMYIGGALQLFFGVIGKRWFDNRDILNLVNDDWVRPCNDDKPLNFKKVEKGCYW